MRLTISSKLALGVAILVLTTVGAMAWITGYNLKRGFVDYLNDLQENHLRLVSEVLADQYRTQGNFDWLRQHPRKLARLLAEREGRHGGHGDGPHDGRLNGRQNRPPSGPPEGAPDTPPDGPPAFAPRDADGGDPARAANDVPRPPPPGPPGPPGAPGPGDPLGFGSRLTVQDAAGISIIGPDRPSPGFTRDIVVDGQVVGHLILMPLRQPDTSTDTRFLQAQLRSILILALVLVVVSSTLAFAFGRRLIAPLAAVRQATSRIARGQFQTRLSNAGGDEIAELAQDVNAMAESLEKNDQQRREMLADMSHELRTPLTVIRGEIEAMQDGVRKTDIHALNSLHQEIQHLTKLVNDMHQLALADSGALSYHPSDLDLCAVVDEIVGRHVERAAQSRLSLHCSHPDRSLLVHLDRDRLAQVMTNLIENSIRYTDPGGRILVTLTRKGALAEIVVEDSAPGVPGEFLHRIFDRLYRADAARSRDKGGSGIGLSLCKAIVLAQRGTIDASASSLGGLKMTILFPLRA